MFGVPPQLPGPGFLGLKPNVKLFLGENFSMNDGSIQVLTSLTSEPARHW